MAEAAKKPFKSSNHLSEEINARLVEAVSSGVFPGCTCIVTLKGKTIYDGALGTLGRDDLYPYSSLPVLRDTVYDLASITGILVTTLLSMQMVDSGKFRLTDRVSRFLPTFGTLGKSPITVGHLLSHTSGLPSWSAFFEQIVQQESGPRKGMISSRGSKDYVINSINRMQIKGDPGQKRIFSDLGFIILGAILELVTGSTLDRAFHGRIAAPLGIKNTGFVDLSLARRKGLEAIYEKVAPTKNCPWRRKVLVGEVNDDNAWAMGGVAGHSGLFGTASDVNIIAQELLNSLYNKGRTVSRNTAAEFLASDPLLGVERPSSENGMDECGFGPHAFGQNSFTGCSLWIDPDKELSIVLLSNRIHPTESNKKIAQFRPAFFREVLSLL